MHDDPLKRAICLGSASVLLVLTALLQIYRVEEQDLHPWKGGGFGMFAASPEQRALRIIPIDENRIGYITPMPSRYRGTTADRLLFRPAESRLREFARQLLTEDWLLIGIDQEPGKQYPVPRYDILDPSSSEPIRIVEIRLEVHVYRYDADSDELRATLLTEIAEKPEQPR